MESILPLVQFPPMSETLTAKEIYPSVKSPTFKRFPLSIRRCFKRAAIIYYDAGSQKASRYLSRCGRLRRFALSIPGGASSKRSPRKPRDADESIERKKYEKRLARRHENSRVPH